MLRAKIAGPPGDIGGIAGKVDDVLPGAAAGLQHVAGLAGEIPLKHRPDRRVVAMERGPVEPAVGLRGSTVPAKFHYILRHHGLLSRFQRRFTSAGHSRYSACSARTINPT